ncbi:MAG: hypothetical protein K6A44_04315 [bacterium]|nr:hypothetical protein [bacterium]
MQINSIPSVNFKNWSDIIDSLAESYLNTPEKIIEDVKMEGEWLAQQSRHDCLDIADSFEQASQRIEKSANRMATTNSKVEKLSLLDKIRTDLRIMTRDRRTYGKRS